MSFSAPKGWERDSDKLFIHNTGVRIQFMTYRSKEGWYLVPTDLDQPVVEFEPTPEGRDKAFEAFAKGALVTKPKKKKASTAEKPKKKAVAAAPAEEGEEGAEKEKGDDEEGEDEEEDDDDEVVA